MFGKLKNKLKDWTSKVADAEEEIKELEEIQEEEIIKETPEAKKSFFKKLFSKKEKEDEKESEENIKTPKEEPETPAEEIDEKTKSTQKEQDTSNNDSGVISLGGVPLAKEDKTLKEKAKEKQPTDEELKKEVKKDDYKKLPQVSTPGSRKTEPDIQAIKESAQKAQDKSYSQTHKLTNSQTREKKSVFKKLISSKRTITEEEFDEHAEDLEMILLENNVALEVVDKIIEELKEKIIGVEMSKKEILDKITESLSEKIKEILQEPFDMVKEIKEKNGVYTIIFCGINGVGKTTQIAKFAKLLKKEKISCVMAAGDTFRAAAVEQLKQHGENLNIKVISHDYGSDPASVGFDAIKYAEKNKIKVVLIDTAGRIHTATNLLKEMEKIKRVCKPDRTIFVGESITGNDAVDQVKAFNEHIGIDGIFLSKADIDEKGGTALSVGYITQKPIIFLGTGQGYEDIEPFNKQKFLEKLELE
jgi:fused signal recognition particle receptor